MPAESRTTERKAQDYTAMGHSVSLIDIIRGDSDSDHKKNLTAEELKDTVSRNVEHLEIMVGLEDWGSEDMTASNAAITNYQAQINELVERHETAQMAYAQCALLIQAQTEAN